MMVWVVRRGEERGKTGDEGLGRKPLEGRARSQSVGERVGREMGWPYVDDTLARGRVFALDDAEEKVDNGRGMYFSKNSLEDERLRANEGEHLGRGARGRSDECQVALAESTMTHVCRLLR
jgi:hypothetical protein